MYKECKSNKKWKCIFRTYFCRISDASWRHHIWSRLTLHSWWPWSTASFETLERQLPFREHHCRTANRRKITQHKTVDFRAPFSTEIMCCFSDAPLSQAMFAIRRAARKCKTCNQAATSSPKFCEQCEPYFKNQWGNGFATLDPGIH
jgi:hypothetical protein